MRVAVIGTGYVGLVAATCFADSGNTVITVDKIEAKIKKLLGGEIPIFEPGLEEMVKRNLAAKRLIPTTDMRYVLNADLAAISSAFFLLFPSPVPKTIPL